MKISWLLVLVLAGNCAWAQTSSSKTSARIRTLTAQEGVVTEILSESWLHNFDPPSGRGLFRGGRESFHLQS